MTPYTQLALAVCGQREFIARTLWCARGSVSPPHLLIASAVAHRMPQHLCRSKKRKSKIKTLLLPRDTPARRDRVPRKGQI